MSWYCLSLLLSDSTRRDAHTETPPMAAHRTAARVSRATSYQWPRIHFFERATSPALPPSDNHESVCAHSTSSRLVTTHWGGWGDGHPCPAVDASAGLGPGAAPDAPLLLLRHGSRRRPRSHRGPRGPRERLAAGYVGPVVCQRMGGTAVHLLGKWRSASSRACTEATADAAAAECSMQGRARWLGEGGWRWGGFPPPRGRGGRWRLEGWKFLMSSACAPCDPSSPA